MEFEIELEDAEGRVVSARARLRIAQGPDGEAHQERPDYGVLAGGPVTYQGTTFVPEVRLEEAREEAREAIVAARVERDEEHTRLLRLSQAVLEGCEALYRITVEREHPGDAPPRQAILREARLLANAIGDGGLLASIERALEEYGDEEKGEDRVLCADLSPDPENAVTVEALARFILASEVSRDDLEDGKVLRIAVARTVLRFAREVAERLGGGNQAWRRGAAAAIMASHPLDRPTAERIAGHAAAWLLRLTPEERRSASATVMAAEQAE